MKKICVAGIDIEVRKKKIKNMYLSVKADGRVVISAPVSVSGRSIVRFAEEKLAWIIKQKKKCAARPPEEEHRYVSGERLYIWGKQHLLLFREDGRRNSFEVREGMAILSMRPGSTVEQREKYVRERYRDILKEAVGRILPQWEERTGLHCNSWQTKYMKTRWGTCNTAEKRLWFNVDLAKKPEECLEYVILHELVHTKVRNHGAAFTAYMDRYMPQWREIRKRLNEGVS